MDKMALFKIHVCRVGSGVPGGAGCSGPIDVISLASLSPTSMQKGCLSPNLAKEWCGKKTFWMI